LDQAHKNTKKGGFTPTPKRSDPKWGKCLQVPLLFERGSD